MKILLGLVGEKGGGKDTFANVITECLQKAGSRATVGHYRTSGLLGETLDRWHIPRTRRNLQELAIVMDKGFGLGTLTNALTEDIKYAREDIVVFDAVRWMSDVTMIRKFSPSLIVYITAPVEVRYERTKLRKEKVGESMAPLEQFLKEENIATELDIPKIGARADARFDNVNSLEKFKSEVQAFCKERLVPLLSTL